MLNTRHSKCLECHIKAANYLIHLVQKDNLNSPQKKKKKKNTSSIFLDEIPLVIDFVQ